jgi:formylglycine-generating enzyme required for sulfatase activity
VADTNQVGSYPAGASPYGALDMAGNVEEWAADWNEAYSAGTQRNPGGPKSGIIRALRGSSWGGSDQDLRTTYRDGDLPIDASGNIGFRCSSRVAP